MITLNYTYRLYPDSSQVLLLNEWLEICRVSYNYALRELKDWIASRKCPIDRCSLESEYIMSADYPFPGYHQQQNNLPKAKEVFLRLAAVPSQVLQTNIRRLHDAWDFFRHRGYGFPRFKKYGQMKSILFPQFRTNPLSGWQLSLPKLGKVQINLHRPIPDGFVIKQIRIIKKAMGWFATISIASDIEIPKPSPYGHCIGIDIGLLSYLATSDSFIESGHKFFKDTYRRLKVLQHRLSKKKKREASFGRNNSQGIESEEGLPRKMPPQKCRSANYEKARIKVEKQHNHIAFTRKDYQYKLAHKVCDMADSIFVEDIDFRIMAKGFLGKHTVDAAFGQFRSILKYVGWQRGKFVGEVNHKGTSQTCPNCRTSVRKKLEDRWNRCPECLYECDRDIASAQEICNRGIEQTYRGTPEKQEIDSQIVVLSGAMSLDKWRRGVMPNSDIGKPALYYS